MNGAKAGQRRGAMGECEVHGAACDHVRISLITKAGFLGESIGIEPVDQLLAPTRDHCSLRVVHMGVNKACGNEVLAVIGDGGVRVRGAQIGAAACRSDPASLDQNAACAIDSTGVLPVIMQRIGVELQGLAKE